MSDFRRTGLVTRLYTRAGSTNIRLDIPAADAPQNGYFQLLQTHENYNALYALALACAVNRHPLQIRITADDITPDEVAQVQYLVADW
jgi:hypothetical protein